MKTVLLITLGCVSLLVTTLPATASSTQLAWKTSKNCEGVNCAIPPEKLPNPPTFTPKSGQASVLHTLVIGGLVYQVCYIYGNTIALKNLSSGWNVVRYSVTILQSYRTMQKARQKLGSGKGLLTCPVPVSATKAANAGNKPHI